MTSRELVFQTLNMENPRRVPRQLWMLPWAKTKYPAEAEALGWDFPADMTWTGGHEREQAPTKGDLYVAGEFVDAWGCTFVNIQDGVQGEVKDSLVKDWTTDRAKIHIPREWLTIDRDAINRDCAATDVFKLSGACPRPFEQLQFIRGTEELYIDLLDPVPAMRAFVHEMHEFHCEQLTRWAKTDVDALSFMDDWGSQRSLLISPALWREWFKPMYRDYVQIAHSHGKKVTMHSDGYILDVIPDLIEIGVDALNSQIFCMGLDKLEPFAGKITFWGEIDRQHLLTFDTTPAEVDLAVRAVHRHLWRNGGCIAQCEFGPAGSPANVRQVFQTWNEVVK